MSNASTVRVFVQMHQDTLEIADTAIAGWELASEASSVTDTSGNAAYTFMHDDS